MRIISNMHSKSLTTLVLMVAVSLVIQSKESESETGHPAKNNEFTSEIAEGPTKGYSRKQRNEEWLNFGNKIVGPLSKFQRAYVYGTKWVGFFFEESLAIVLASETNNIVDCTLLELKEEEEQQEAMRVFGEMMDLVPVSLQDQIQLNRLCGEFSFSQLSSGESNVSGKNSLTIIPGTKWCGMGDRARMYQELGEKSAIDKCCRTHDNCPMKVSSLRTKYGLTNLSLQTRSHCLCEEELYFCLKNRNNTLANIIGNIYFNIINLRCLQEPGREKSSSNEFGSSVVPAEQLYQCQLWDRDSRCKRWKKRKIHYTYEFIPFEKPY